MRLILLASMVICARAFGATIALWDFNSVPTDNDANTGTLAPAKGFGTAALVGQATASFTASNGSSDPNPSDNSNWRITNWPAQGTQNKGNGIQFLAGTVGYRDIAIRWDQRNSNTASKYARLQYTTNGVDFTDHTVITMPAETWTHGLEASFSGISGAEDNALFGVRFVTEFENTATGAGTNGYVPSNLGSVYGAVGTLRFDMVTLTGRPIVESVSVLSYNVLGRGAADWSTNAAQVQAIGRQMRYLKPDIIGFQEIPETNHFEMTNFIAAYLPGYHLATGLRTDGGERTVVASRFPITRSKSWLARSNLTAFGYSGVFTRDLFEAEIEVPGFSQPLHVFNTHLKAFGDPDPAARRGAEARAISNHFVTAHLTTNALRPYVLLGDMNEDIFRPRQNEQDAINTMANASTGLRITTPRNPVSNDDRTWSIQNPTLTIRFDYVLPCGLLFSNVISSQVFRSDLVNPPAPPMLPGDSATAADHLPVMMVFRNPYTAPFTIRSLTLNGQSATLTWSSVTGGRYRVEMSENLEVWSVIASNLTAVGGETSHTTSIGAPVRFMRVALEEE